MADAQYIKTDMLSALAILIGLITEILGIGLDKIVALFIMAFIGKVTWEILIDSIQVLSLFFTWL